MINIYEIYALTIMIDVGARWKETRDGQSKTYHQSMETLAIERNHVSRYGLLGWSLRDYHNQWGEILNYMAQARSQ